jgi:hypothetical protein
MQASDHEISESESNDSSHSSDSEVENGPEPLLVQLGDNFNPQPVHILPEGSVMVHERLWKEEEVPVDPSVHQAKWVANTRINWGHDHPGPGIRKREYHYFMLLFPWAFFAKVIESTNRNLIRSKRAPTNKGEFIKWLGL